MVRRVVDTFRQPKAKKYPDPVFVKKPSTRYRRKTIERKRRLGPPECYPGTVTYRDALVRHLGYDRRKADGWLYAWRNYGTALPKLYGDVK